jgi:Kelch motif
MRLLLPVGVLLLAGCSTGTAAPSPTASATRLSGLSQRFEQPLPEVRQETAAAADGRDLWVIGGYDGRSQSSPDVWRFDGSWHREQPLPLGLNHPSAAVLEGAVYVAGGYGASGPSRRVFRLVGAPPGTQPGGASGIPPAASSGNPSASSGNPAGAQPALQEVAPLRHARGALALVAVAGRLHAIGGTDQGGEVAPAEEYDPSTGRWRDLPELSHPRDHLSGFAYQGMACVAGGRSPNVPFVSCWDRGRGRWRELPPLPAPTSGAGGGALGDVPVVAGGEDPGASQLVTQLAVLRAGAWQAGRMLAPRHGIQLANYRGRLWACGGGDRAGLHPVPTCTSIG